MLYVDVTKPPSPEAVAGLLEFSALSNSVKEWAKDALLMEHDPDKPAELNENVYKWWTRYGGGHSFLAALHDLKVINLPFQAHLLHSTTTNW